MKQCKRLITRPGQFRASRCMRYAVEGGDYCAFHSPEAQKARADELDARVEARLAESRQHADCIAKMQSIMQYLKDADVPNLSFGNARMICMDVKAHLPMLLEMAMRKK